ncbi:aldehyde dehydrogenase family protein [Sphingobium vermicomposti]|uniref:Acyl-CoA reductase-like NAD-dependent aldehyde dehydrogenase n=1 Tax=Sphingobium vermicomposti TaxID=529005 RepID=A0A846MCH5_9SPHN|nr:aldehyde dehydrogenase family protein [Sphingobium vermicomposti]NIJ17864.1 acyl-CoA reductase-like NAD-dependent aldehyde dehydrogenase [Sphingobium vermicomposti]
MSEYRMLINGRLVSAEIHTDVINPANEKAIASCPRASVEQLNEAVAAAKAAGPAWAATTIEHRRSALLKLADALHAKREEFSRLLTQEQGKPLAEATAEVDYTEDFIRHFAGLDLPMKVIEENDVRRVELHRKPLGVVAVIIPWNFPVFIIAFKLPMALLAGNTVVMKPAPTTPLTALKFGELCAEIFPPGVVNIIADDNDLGSLLTKHSDIAKISFTGSTATGKKVMASAAESIKRVTLELGGNDAGIVLDDADPKAAAPGIFAGAFTNAGQVCIALKRLYVHESVYDAVCDELMKLANEAVVDDGLKQGAQVGPLQNRMQYEKVKGFLDDARKDGRIVAGGEIPDRPGFFVRPTIVRDIEDGSRLVDDEQFGPILPLIKYRDAEDALARANASPYGLGASVWSSDMDRAYDLAVRLEAGTVWINKHFEVGPNIPFGGAKMSGLGVEFAEEGLAEFTQVRVVNIAI